MARGSWFAGVAVDVWLAMALLWVAVLGLAAWAVSVVHPRPRRRGGPDPVRELDVRLAAGELAPDAYRAMRAELTSAKFHRRP